MSESKPHKELSDYVLALEQDLDAAGQENHRLRETVFDLEEQYEVLKSSEAQAWNKAQREIDERQRWAAETHRLEEQLEAARFALDGSHAIGYREGVREEKARMKEQLETYERTLRAIAFNALSFHKGEDGKDRALAVIYEWASNPDLVPGGIGEESNPAKRRRGDTSAEEMAEWNAHIEESWLSDSDSNQERKL